MNDDVNDWFEFQLIKDELEEEDNRRKAAEAEAEYEIEREQEREEFRENLLELKEEAELCGIDVFSLECTYDEDDEGQAEELYEVLKERIENESEDSD